MIDCHPAPRDISSFLVQNIPMNLQKAEIMFASGLHDFLSFISIAQKETFHIFLVQAEISL